MSTDEARQPVESRSGQEGQQFLLPLHLEAGSVSAVEVTNGDGRIRRDPERAHTEVGDPEGLQRRPEDCYLCEAEVLAETAAAEKE